MKLSTDQYERGIVKWTPSSVTEVRTSAVENANDPDDWSAPLTDAEGSIAQSPSGRFVNVACKDEIATSTRIAIKWDRQYQGYIQSFVSEIDDIKKTTTGLKHIPGFGVFHRIVVEALPSLTWTEDCVLRVQEVVVRFVTGTIIGEHVPPIDKVEVSVDRTSITSEPAGTVEADGRFIEIVAPGEDMDSAELNATAILGYLALVAGPNVLGPIRFSEPYTAEPGKPQKGRYKFPITYKIPSTVSAGTLILIDQGLATAVADDQLKNAVRLALHWFERGVRFDLPVDQLASFFIGIESILNTYTSINGPIPETEARKKVLSEKLPDLLKGHIEPELIARLRDCGTRASTREKFRFYSSKRNLDASWTAKFDVLAITRNHIFHGQPMSATFQSVSDARELLITMLKCELGLKLATPWDGTSRLLEVILEWEFPDSRVEAT